QPMVGRIGGAIDLSRIPVEDIERVEIVKGAGSALYGADAIGGVVNVITRRGAEGIAATGRLSGGTFLSTVQPVTTTRLPGSPGFLANGPLSTADVAVGLDAGRGRWSSRSSASALATPATRGPGGSTVMDGQGTVAVSERVDLRITPDHRLTARTGYTLRQSAGLDASDTGAIADRSQTTELVDIAVSPDVLFGGQGRLQATLSWNAFRDQYLVDQRDAVALDKYEETFDHATELDVLTTWVVGERHAVSGGIEGRLEQLRADRLQPSNVGRQRGALFAQDVWELDDSEELLLVSGLRYDQDTLFGGALSPRLASRVPLSHALVMRASIGRGFRAPPFKDLYLSFANPGANYRVDGNPALRPETAWTETVDLDWRVSDAIHVEAGAHRTDLDDMIMAVLAAPAAADAPARYSYDNIQRAWTQGATLGGSWMPGPGVRLGLVGSWLQTRDVEEDRALAGRPPFTVDTTVGLGAPGAPVGCTLRGGWQAAAPVFFDENGDGVDETSEAPDAFIVDARLAWRPTRAIEVFGGIDNALDTGDPALNPMRPRRVFAGVNGRVASRRSGT
ncbi:MAG: TonB-dependent receptor, partial [Myxococcota bacterium]|nr:TonB-dependent receptor [Myxococcota bacterium]